jgi:hypothetical protein
VDSQILDLIKLDILLAVIRKFSRILYLTRVGEISGISELSIEA